MSLVFQRTTARMAQLIPQKADPRQCFQTLRTHMCGVARFSVNVTQGRYLAFFVCFAECCSRAEGGGCADDPIPSEDFDMDRRQGGQEPPATAILDGRAFHSAAAALIDGPDVDGQPSEQATVACSEGHATGACLIV